MIHDHQKAGTHLEYGRHSDYKIATIINFCTIDYKFIRHCVKSVTPFSRIIIVPYADRLFDNTSENFKLIETAKEQNPEAIFQEFQYHQSITASLGVHFWHNYARWVGVSQLPPEIDYVLFLDADEIVETEKFIDFVLKSNFAQYDYLYLANYWYFREPRFRARQIEDSPVLAKKSIISKDNVFLSGERSNFTLLPNGIRWVLGLDNQPMIHHYSWVRSKDEMLRKVITWGHRDDKDWVALVRDEFSREFSGTDFVHGYQYDIVEPYINFEFQQETSQIPIPAFRDAIDTSKVYSNGVLRKRYALTKENVGQINLTKFSRYVSNIKHRNYFFDIDFSEHYRLIAYLGTLFKHSVIFDIGTYLGYSALALSHNRSNRIVSYDIIDCKELNFAEELTNIEYQIGDVMQDTRLLDSPLIMLDTNHDGVFENKFYNYLKENNYSGLLFLDDIHLNSSMKSFWSSIVEPKEDITDLGHWSGSGLVDFGFLMGNRCRLV